MRNGQGWSVDHKPINDGQKCNAIVTENAVAPQYITAYWQIFNSQYNKWMLDTALCISVVDGPVFVNFFFFNSCARI